MKNVVKEVGGKFSKFLTLSLKKEWTKFSYADDEYGQKQKEGITIALILWKFLRKFTEQTGYYGWEAKRAFIADFLLNNPLAKQHAAIRLVAKIEALPTTVWRKLLWRENIDFPDYEPCLRRLSFDQQFAIEHNHAALFSTDKPETPPVLRKSWRDRVKSFFGMLSPDSLLEEEYDDIRRNQSKGAYAFSLLGLDFGFSLYPNGDNDDRKITNKKFTRFLSVKSHINDFIVNKEDGKYWWLYKTARSNYAFYPNKKVQMKNHVCPGFWWTLIVQSLFWIVSPLALLSTGLTIANNGFIPTSLIPAIFAFPMIIWTCVLVMRTIVNFIYELIKDIKWLSMVGMIIGISAGVAVIAFIIGAILVAMGLSIAGLSPIFGPLLSTAFVLTAGFYVVFFLTNIMNSNNSWFEYDDVPRFVRYLLHMVVGAFIISIIDKFVSTPVINVTVYIAQSLWEWYTSNLLVTNWFIFSLIFFVLFAYFFEMYLSDEKRFASFEKTFTWLTKGFMAITIIVIVIFLTKNQKFDVDDFGLAPSLALSILFLVSGFSLMMLNQVNKVSIAERERAAEFLLDIKKNIGGIAYKSYVASLLGSKWLPTNIDEKWKVIDQIRSLAFTFFEDNDKHRIGFVELLVQKGSLNIVSRLNREWSDIMCVNSNAEEKYLLVQLMITGSSLDEAIKIMEQKRTIARKLANRAKKISSAIALPFVAIWQAICWFFSKIWQFLCTLKDLWDFFNKRCPFVTQSRYLD